MTKWYIKVVLRAQDSTVVLTRQMGLDDIGGLVFAPPSENEIEWDIATTDSPYYDGGDVTNRVARRREISLVWAYDNQSDVSADDYLFNIISPAIASNSMSQELYIIKVENVGDADEKRKQISGVISSISRPEIKRKKHLQIVLDCEPYWHGEPVDITEDELTVSSDGTYSFPIYNPGDIAVNFDLTLNYTVDGAITTVVTEYHDIDDIHQFYNLGQFSFSGIGQEIHGRPYKKANITTRDGIYAITVENEVSESENALRSFEGDFFDLKPRMANVITVSLEGDAPHNTILDSVRYVFEPLYVR